MPIQPFQVGARVLYTCHSTLEPGIITHVHVVLSDDSPDAVETYRYDIDLDAGGSLLHMSEHITPAP